MNLTNFANFLVKAQGFSNPRGILPGMYKGAMSGLGWGVVSSVSDGDQSQLGAMGVGTAMGGLWGSKFGRGLTARALRSNIGTKARNLVPRSWGQNWGKPGNKGFYRGVPRLYASRAVPDVAVLGVPSLIGACVLGSNEGYR